MNKTTTTLSFAFNNKPKNSIKNWVFITNGNNHTLFCCLPSMVVSSPFALHFRSHPSNPEQGFSMK